MTEKPPPLILASRSPRRKILLRSVGFRVRVVPGRVEERVRLSESPQTNVRRIALEKALDVASRRHRGIVVAADTIVVIRGRILEKPKSRSDAMRMLKLLSGKRHVVFTGFAIVDAATGRSFVGMERTAVTFRKLERAEIDAYVASGSPFDKAGAYGIQDDYGSVFVTRVDGCFYTVVGFPLARFWVELRKFLKRKKNEGT
ncbi:MAG TPA: Maf family protein [Bacteroidota bacterium]|nr:Maf family protein [Bacteroidota bacterium]